MKGVGEVGTHSIAVGGVASALLALCPAGQACDAVFTDQTGSALLNAVHDPSDWLLVSPVNVSAMLGGGAVGDFNNDGHQDIFFLSGGTEADKLFINNGNGTFSEASAAWGVDYAHMGVGTAVGDFNDDGFLDIFVTSLGPATAPTQPGHHLLYRNNGGVSFSEIAGDAGVAAVSTTAADGFGATFNDYDLDGDLDLLVVGWVESSGSNRLYRNDGKETFIDVTADAGLAGLLTVRGFSPRLADMDGDRWPELLVAADFGTSRYLINNTDGTFTDFTTLSGTGLDGNGMGHAIGDFDGNGLLDWYVTSIYTTESFMPSVPGTGNMLYLNQGGHVYAESSLEYGVKDGGWGWGTVTVDFDHDGLNDLIETNGWPFNNGPQGPEWSGEQAYVFQNAGASPFTEIAGTCGFDHTGQGRGLANLDYDNDGDQDVLVFSSGEPLVLYRNDVSGLGCNWLRVFLDTTGHPQLAPHGIGTRVTINIGGAVQIRSIDGGSNYLVQSELSAHFGLGSATVVDEVRVLWGDGTNTVLRHVPRNRTLSIDPDDHTSDVDGDGTVGIGDFLAVLGTWGACPDAPQVCFADIDGDGVVGINDFLYILGEWGS